MRLGKEQAVGYVEDTEADSLPAEESHDRPGRRDAADHSPRPSLTVR